MGIQREFVVDVLAVADELGEGRGRIGMCRLPGYEIAELAGDVGALAATGASLVVTLLQTEELYFLLGMMDEGTGFFARMGGAGFFHRHFPIVNGGVPGSMAELAGLV